MRPREAFCLCMENTERLKIRRGHVGAVSCGHRMWYKI